jgi:hypothetical protein
MFIIPVPSVTLASQSHAPGSITQLLCSRVPPVVVDRLGFCIAEPADHSQCMGNILCQLIANAVKLQADGMSETVIEMILSWLGQFVVKGTWPEARDRGGGQRGAHPS